MKVNDQLLEQRIQDKLRELIADRGLKGWNMDQLAVAAGITKPTLYKIIDTKEKLIERVIIGHIHEMQSRVVEIIDEDLDMVSALGKMVDVYAAFFENGATNYMNEVLMEYPAIEQQVIRHNDEMTQHLIGLLKNGVENGVLRSNVDPELTFDLLRAVVHFNVTSGLTGRECADRIRRMFKLVLHGILK